MATTTRDLDQIRAELQIVCSQRGRKNGHAGDRQVQKLRRELDRTRRVQRAQIGR